LLSIYQDRNEPAGGLGIGQKLVLPGFPLPEPPMGVRPIMNGKGNIQALNQIESII